MIWSQWACQPEFIEDAIKDNRNDVISFFAARIRSRAPAERSSLTWE